MSKIVMTGGSGFVGKNFIKYLPDSYESIITINRLEFNKIDEFLNDADVFIHLAGKAHDLKQTSDSDEYYLVNFELTKILYNAFLKSNARKFIFISSVKAVADSVVGVLDEDIHPNPQTDYGKSKLLAEQYIKNQQLSQGKSYYILRPCMIHGPGNKGNLNLLYNFVKKGVPYPLADFNNKRSFLSIENFCFIINELVDRDDIQSGIYNVADDEALATNQVVSILASSLNTKLKLWKISPAIIRFFAKIGDVLHLPLTSERLNKLTESYIVSNQKIKNAIGKELPLTSIEGLKLTANSFN